MISYLRKWAIVIVMALLLIALGVFLAFGGHLSAVTGAGGHVLVGADRFLAIIPISVGGLLLWVTLPSNKKGKK